MEKSKEKKFKEVVINTCYGGFGLSDLAYEELIKLGIPVLAYEELIKLGIPVRKYIPKKRNPETGLYDKEPKNEGKVIFDRELTPPGEDEMNDIYWKYKNKSKFPQRYWDCWTKEDRENPLLIKVIKKLGKKANSFYSNLKIVKIPADVDYEIQGYDGLEHIAEKHRTWQ